MSLKDVMAADLSAVFFNTSEFAELHTVNGVQLTCVVDTDITKVRSGIESEQYDGVFLSMVQVHIKKTDIPKRPTRGKVLKFDEKPYIIGDCADEEGVWVITLGLNDG